MFRVDCPYPPPHHMTDLWWELPPSLIWKAWLLFELSPEHCYVSSRNHCHTDMWTAWLVLTHHHHFINTNSPFTRTPWKREWVVSFCLDCHVAFFSARFLGCLELYSNSHFSILEECRPWVTLNSHGPASCLAIKRTIWSGGFKPNSLLWARFETLGLR